MSMTRDKYDAVVVGASLAGCTTATLLARRGLRVALVDKHSGDDAYKKLCGHYVQASARGVLERLGVADTIEAAGGVRNGADVWTRWGIVRSPEPLAERPYGYSIRRLKLDPILRRRALETPGVDYLPKLHAVGLVVEGGASRGVEVEDRSGRRNRLAAPLTVGADGRASTVATLARAREKEAPNERFCYMAYFSDVGLPPDFRGRLWSLDPDVAITAPNDDGLTLLAAFLHKRRLGEFRDDRLGAVRDLFASLPDGPDLADARPAGKAIGYTDYGIVARDPLPLPGVALVGDAALTCDPVMAIGCGWALQSGEWLADAVVPALQGTTTMEAALRAYRRERRRKLLPHHLMLVGDARAKRMNPVQRLLFSAGTRDPKTAKRLHEYAQRTISPMQLLSPRSLGRAAWARAFVRA